MKIDGVRIVWKKPNKKSCFCQKFPHTNVGGNTNVQYVERYRGYKADDHLQKVFTNCDQKKLVKKFQSDIKISFLRLEISYEENINQNFSKTDLIF